MVVTVFRVAGDKTRLGTQDRTESVTLFFWEGAGDG